MGEARARFRPSTVISTVAPRDTPCGDTELMVGGVMRVPVGESLSCANIEVAIQPKTRIDLMSISQELNVIHQRVNSERAIETSCREALSVRREFQRQHPIGLFGERCDLVEVVRLENL